MKETFLKKGRNILEMMRITCEIIIEERAENIEKKIMGHEVLKCKVLKSSLYSFPTRP